MRKRNMIALSVFVIFYICFGVLLAVFQEKVVYQPYPQDFETCRGFADAEKVTYEGTRMYVKGGEKGVAVLYHGNAGSACDRDFYAYQFVKAGYGYIIPEYAGYSNDTRSPTHDLVKKDVRNVVSYLESLDVGHVVVVGESVGTGLASYHVSLATPDTVFLISPFSSLVDVAKHRFWFYPTSFLVNNAFDNIALLSSYEGSVTIMHGDSDAIIPQKLGRKLFENLNTTEKTFISLEGMGHNDVFTSEEPYEVMQSVLSAM